eukprot:CAMPEP_0178930474 /NCGR_PEP_ID=MMETSP0786-20121207/21248_1 /TAXON_ID=186022 /ORGANISM="Thalassionema frauenfeldii, Strain CCMP 1798" /LENGTH=364 /DNA_ID=CAMNT_0020606991 /DNA_START=217 /DNA_END=1308 /DNA_ORIENTATION=+
MSMLIKLQQHNDGDNDKAVTKNHSSTKNPAVCNESITGGIKFINISLPPASTMNGIYPVVKKTKQDDVASNRSDTAFCNMHRYIYMSHFPHYMEFALRCWSFFQMNVQYKNKVMILTDSLDPTKFGHFIKSVNDVLAQLGINIEKYAAANPLRLKNSTSVTVMKKQQKRDAPNQFPYWMASIDHGKEFRKQFLTTLQLDTNTTTIHQSCNKTFPKIAIIDRRNNRKLLNVESIAESIREEFGIKEPEFSVAYFEGASFRDQAKFFSQTDIVISPHGAQLTGMVFMPDNGALLEIYPVGWVIPWYFGSLSKCFGLDHAYIYETEEKLDKTTLNLLSKNDNLAQKRNLCIPTSVIVEGVQQLVRRW